MIAYPTDDLEPAQYVYIKDERCFIDEFGRSCWPIDIPSGVLNLFFKRKTYLVYAKSTNEIVELFYDDNDIP